MNILKTYNPSLLVFYLGISGKDIKDEHSLNIFLISFTLLVLHLGISGKDINDEHSESIYLIFFTQ